MTDSQNATGLLNHPSVKTVMAEEGIEPLEFNATEEVIVRKIMHTLKLYPGVSMTMLQVGIGTSIPPELWKPIYHKMLNARQLFETSESVEAPNGRIQSYKHIHIRTK